MYGQEFGHKIIKHFRVAIKELMTKRIKYKPLGAKNIIINKYIVKKDGEKVSKVIKDLDRLHPYVNKLAKMLIERCRENGIEIIITETFRTKKRQQQLYNKGRTTSGKVITNAKPGDSMHNYGLAFDIVPVEKGKLLWNRNDLFKKIGKIGVDLGLTWGGNWRSFKDYPHFEWTGGLTLKDLKRGKMPVEPKAAEVKLEVSEWAQDALDWVVREGISDGINPKDQVPSQGFWTILHRYRQKYGK